MEKDDQVLTKGAEPKIVAAPISYYRYDMRSCPRGAKLILLTRAGIAVIGQYDGGPGYIAWAPLPDRDKSLEKELGL